MDKFGISLGRIREFVKEEKCPDDWEMFPCFDNQDKCLGIVFLSPDRKSHGWIDATDKSKDVHTRFCIN